MERDIKNTACVPITPVIKDSFIQYSGAVLQSRALVDVRDCLKPSARQIFYSLEIDKNIHSKPFKKTLKTVASTLRFYIHGDTSCLGIIMRAGQPFATRYPLIDVWGNGGNLMSSGNWAAPRYTGSRLSELGSIIYGDIKKDTISDWRDNYDDTEQYPSVSTSKGFYNIVNGAFGIGIGMGSSIPAFNLNEVNAALVKLLWNKDIDFDEIYCEPDFATGGIIMNGDVVKESIKAGNGKSCCIRSKVDYDKKDRVLIVSEIPYGVYTNTICKELEEIVNDEETNMGIERFNDLTGSKPNIKIYLSKKANVEKVISYLYKRTSLQHYYGVNFTMLENGRFPRMFTWKEALQSHLDHEVEVYTRGYKFDLEKITKRINIIDGLLIALASIDEVIKTIKSSGTPAAASTKLCKEFLLNEDQAKAILNMKLSKLSHLEVKKLENEKKDLLAERKKITDILSDDTLLKNEIEKGLIAVAKKFGDSRRTKILSVGETEEEEVIDEKQLSLAYTNDGAVFTTETSTLFSQKKNGVGSKFKLDDKQFIVGNMVGKSNDLALFFSSTGKFYHLHGNEFKVEEKQFLSTLVPIAPDEEIKAAAFLGKETKGKNIIFVTKKGYVKKTLLSNYNLKRKSGSIAIVLEEEDEIVSILFTDDEKIGILSEKGRFIMIDTDDITPIGRKSRGVVGMKLDAGDFAVSAKTIPSGVKEILSISVDGYSKRTSINEFRVTKRNTKGIKIQKSANMCDLLPITDEKDILINASASQIRIALDSVSVLSKGAQGTKTIKLKDNCTVTKVTRI